VRVAAAFLGVIFPFLISGAEADLATRVDVTIISCTQDSPLPPTVMVHPYPKPNILSPLPVQETRARYKVASGVYEASLVVRPGNYTLTASSINCRTPASADLTVFPNQERHILTITARKYAVLRTLLNNSIGILSPPGMAVRLIPTRTPLARPLLGVRDAEITYFDDLSPGEYLLEVRVGEAVTCSTVEVPNTRLQGYRRLIRLELQQIATYLRAATERSDPHDCKGVSRGFVSKM
jgi:hypothetical protein